MTHNVPPALRTVDDSFHAPTSRGSITHVNGVPIAEILADAERLVRRREFAAQAAKLAPWPTSMLAGGMPMPGVKRKRRKK